MDLFDDFLMYELCFPGAITGETEIDCPYCSQLLTVPVEDPMGQQDYQCAECTGTFEVNWGEGQVRYQAEESPPPTSRKPRISRGSLISGN